MFRGHKFFTMLISLLGAVLLWLYVVTEVKPQTDFRVGAIPIGIIDRTLEERGLIITAQSAESLSLDLRTSRANRSKLNAETITVNADASNIKEPGENIPLACVVTLPDTVRSSDVDILRKSIDTVKITVDRLQRSAFPIELEWSGSVKEGYSFETTSVVIDPMEVVVTGPEKEVGTIERAVVEYDISNLEETTVVTAPIRFLDENGEEVVFSDLTSYNLSQTSVTLPVLRIKKIDLRVEYLEGGGVTSDSASCELTPDSIDVKGAANVIDALPDELVIGKVDLATIPNYYPTSFTLNLPAGVNNVTGEKEVQAVIRLSGVSTDTIDVSDIRLLNPPDAKNFITRITTSTVQISVRGKTEEIEKIKADKNNGIYVEVDLDTYGNQTGTFSVQGRVVNEAYPSVSVSGSVEIGVNISQHTEADQE